MSSRFTRRTALAAGSIGAMALAAGCSDQGGTSGQPSGGTSSSSAFSEKGPIVYASGKDTSGYLNTELSNFSKDHPDAKATLQELSDNADQQRASMIQNAQNKSSAYTVLSMDVVWTAEFAANGYVEQIPDDVTSFDGFLPATLDSLTYFDKKYGVPYASDGALLYYRSDWFEKAGLDKPPTTWAELEDMGKQIKSKVPEAKNADIYGGQFQKYEGLTCNFSEFINSAGGVVVGDDGKPNVDTPEALAGLQQLSDWFSKGVIPKTATTWQEEPSRTAFQNGKLIFLRNWPYVYALASKSDGSSKVNGKFKVAPIPGKSGPGVSTLGGHNMALNKFAKSKGTAIEFMEYMNSEKEMKTRTQKTSLAPTRETLYSDADLVKDLPYLPVLLKSIQTAKPRPKAVKYGDVTKAIQDAAYGAIQSAVSGKSTAKDALTSLQENLSTIIK